MYTSYNKITHYCNEEKESKSVHIIDLYKNFKVLLSKIDIVSKKHKK